MRKLLALAAVFMLLCTIGYAEQQPTHQLHLTVEFDQNIMMARYDVEVLLNGENVATIKHGGYLDARFTVPEGRCTIIFQKVGDPEVYCSRMIGVSRNTSFTCEIHANLKDIEFRSVTTNSDSSLLRIPIGEEVDLNGVAVSLADCSTEAVFGSISPRKGHQFAVCQMVFHNQTEKDIAILALLSSLSFDACCDDFEIDCSYSAMYNMNGEMTAENILSILGRVRKDSEVIRPGKKAIIELVFEVPVNWQLLEVYYRPSMFSAEELIFVAEHE